MVKMPSEWSEALETLSDLGVNSISDVGLSTTEHPGSRVKAGTCSVGTLSLERIARDATQEERFRDPHQFSQYA